VQSDYNDIIALAKRAVGETKDTAEATKKIESFVSEYIENRSLSVGYASAAEVAASRVGDCTEFAVLTAAMCRAVGIPARVVSGIVYVQSLGGRENVFGGHMWIGNGEPADFLNLAATLGRFKIDKVIIEK
jgi:transglutaminase-like putative cysteine protease